VKSSSSHSEYTNDYQAFSQTKDFDRLFYVVHEPFDVGEVFPRSTLIGPRELASLVVSSGLARWLLDKNT
jgi:hypothetical protein